MKRASLILSTLAVFAIVAVFGFVHAGYAEEDHHDKDAPAAKPVALEGEVVDLQCYFSHPEKSLGKDHAKCAKACIAKGLPVGFLSAGKLYLLLGPEHDSAKDLVAEAPGKTIELSGTVIELAGMSAFQLVKPGKKADDGHGDGDGHH